MTNVAFLGLGAMGLPMARNLLRKGFSLHVWNRSPEKARGLASEGAVAAPTPREAAAAADVVATMLSDPAAVEAVAAGPQGLAAGLAPGKLWLDFSTVTPYASRHFAALAAGRGADFCDVPVAGSVGPATDGTLTILAGGQEAALERAGPVLAAVSKAVIRFGGVGHGSAMKLVNNTLFGTCLAAFGEALSLAKRFGLPDRESVDWLLSVPSVAPFVRTKWEVVRATPDAGSFRLALMQKDLRLAVEAAGGDRNAPFVAVARDAFAAADAAGLGGRDMAHILHFLAGAGSEKGTQAS